MGQVAAYALGFWTPGAQSASAILVALAVSAAIGLPGGLTYAILMPSTARLGIMPDGIIVDATSSKSPHFGFRQGYRWADLQLRGRSLVLPNIRQRAPRFL